MTTRDGVEERVQAERERLLELLETLDDDQWRSPSLCGGWSIRDLVVHLLMPYELSAPRFLLLMLRNRFDFDRAAYRWAKNDDRSPSQVIDAFRATEHRRFGVPGAPEEAPLSHLVIHAEDVYRPLAVPSATDPSSARIVLDGLTGPSGRRAVPSGLLDGLALEATDTPWRYGDGAEVRGTAVALLSTIMGRAAALDELSGEGLPQLSERLQAGAVR